MKKRFCEKVLSFDFIFPICVLTLFTIFFRFTNTDIELQRFFYSSERGWFLKHSNPWEFLYTYANLPGLTLIALAILVLILGFKLKDLFAYKKSALFVVLLALIGPGLLTNMIFKKYWGRPRPAQIQEFGGKEAFLPVWVKGAAGSRKSFPSGHASIGFFMIAPFFFLRKTSPKWSRLFLYFGILFGVFVGIGRMVQGGHFASDVLWAFGFVYLSGFVLSCLFNFDTKPLN